MLRFLRRRAAEDTSTQSQPALLAWWESAFTPEESKYILSQVPTDGVQRRPWLERSADWEHYPRGRHVVLTSHSVGYLVYVAPDDLPIARRLLEKGIELGRRNGRAYP